MYYVFMKDIKVYVKVTDRRTTFFILLFYDNQGQSVHRHKNTDVTVGDID